MKLRHIGNSYGIIIPKEILNLLSLTSNSEIDLKVINNQIVLKKATPKTEVESWFENGPVDNRDIIMEFSEDDEIW